jgi:hypothetical protein
MPRLRLSYSERAGDTKIKSLPFATALSWYEAALGCKDMSVVKTDEVEACPGFLESHVAQRTKQLTGRVRGRGGNLPDIQEQ